MKIFHGSIITCDRNRSVVDYLVEDEGKILFVGNELPSIYARCPRRIELGPQALLPAFGDGHIHFSMWSIFNSTYDVREATTISEIESMIRNFSDRDPNIRVLIGFGHSSHCIKEKRLITRQELDRAIKDRPIYLVCYDGHSAVVNSKAIGMFPMEIRRQRGFNIETGLITHEAFYQATDFVSNRLPPLTFIKYLLNSIDTLADYGIGLVHTVEGVGFPRDLDVDLVRFIARSSQLNFRVYFQTMDIRKVLKRKLPRVGGCFACALDGCFGVKDAALIEPYSDDEQNYGVLFYSDEQVIDFAKKANRAGLQIQLHCIGDAAVVQAVKALEKALLDYPRTDHRHTLIHACLIPEPLLEKIARLRIGITIQPGVLTSSLEPVGYHEQILGDRAYTFSPVKDMIKMGINVSGGSDGPVAIPNPINGIYGICNHTNPDQSLSIAEALRMFTYNVACTSFDEKERGSLEKGKVSDMIILNQNPLAMAPQDLRQLEVIKTYLAGEEYQKGKKLPRIIADSFKNRKRPV